MEEMRDVGDSRRKASDYFSLGWIFETWYEKVILLAAIASLVYSVFRIIVQGVW